MNEDVRAAVIEKNRHFLSLSTAQHLLLHGRKTRKLRISRFSSGYEKFRSYDWQPRRAHSSFVNGENPSLIIDDSNVPPLPITKQSRGANKWMTPQEESNAFQVDPRFEVSLFASEEQFLNLLAPFR